jgi:cell division protein FtsB
MTAATGALDRFAALSPGARRVAWGLLAAAVLGVIALLVSGPLQTYREQQSATNAADAQLQQLEQDITEMQDRVTALDSDAEIEAIAREEYSLVYPGEQAYALLPGSPTPVPVPDAWPFAHLRLP